MRDIKFRAWLDYGNGDGEMLQNIQNHINGKWAFGHIASGNVDNVSAPMQYVGLKDKNGVEIYEGDIVDCWDSVDVLSQPVAGASVIGAVDFNGGCFCVKNCDGYHNRLALTCAENVEIIGNIHQNPELLSD